MEVQLQIRDPWLLLLLTYDCTSTTQLGIFSANTIDNRETQLYLFGKSKVA